MINIIVAEPNQMLRLGIRSVLEARPDFAIVGEVVRADDFAPAVLNLAHDVVLAELGLLKQVGRAALRELRDARPASRMLVHSYEIDTDFGANAFKFGAIGYLANDCSTTDLCAAIAKVAAGQPYITRTLGEALAATVCFQASNLPYASSLNRRELQVFKMLSVGLKLTDVARQMGKSVDVIGGYKAQIMAKMALPDASDLVRHAISQSLVSASPGRSLPPDSR